MNDLQPAHPTGPLWPTAIFAAAVVLSLLLHLWYPLPWLGSPLADILFVAGLLVVVAGLAMVTLAARKRHRGRRRGWEAQIPMHLVVDGPYALSRNPIYLGIVLVVMGIGLAAGSTWFIVIAVLAAIAVTHVSIKREERALAQAHGKRYRDYAKRVRRWI